MSIFLCNNIKANTSQNGHRNVKGNESKNPVVCFGFLKKEMVFAQFTSYFESFHLSRIQMFLNSAIIILSTSSPTSIRLAFLL